MTRNLRPRYEQSGARRPTRAPWREQLMITTLHQIFGALVVANFALAIIIAELYVLIRRNDTGKGKEPEVDE